MVRPTEPGPDLRRAVAGALGTEIVSWRPVSGGFSAAGLWTIATAAGSQWFVKAATTGDTARFLRSEMNLYASLQAPFLPTVEAGGEIDQEHPFVVMEDLSDWHWPPPWDRSQINALFETCSDISGTAVPPGLLSGIDPQLDVDYWARMAADPEGLHTLGVASPSWFDRAFPELIATGESAVLIGDSLVHGDIRSDNVCVKNGRTKVVDWNWAYVGNPVLDIVAWLPSLRLEGGPPPWTLASGEAPLVARVAGFFLHHATLSPHPQIRSGHRTFQRAQGAVALEWVAHELGMTPPS